jgi:hypothetical protein
MTADSNDKKSRLSHLPGILGGSAALIAALTTVYVNVRKDDRDSAPAPVATASPAKPAIVEPAAAAMPAGPVRRVLKLERLRVENDGSLGTTDWTFEISAGGDPQYSLTFKSLNDREGQNLVQPPEGAKTSATIETAAGAPIEVTVKGWKRSLILGASKPEISGEARPAPGATSFPVHAHNDDAGGPDITLYFSLTPVAEGRE